MNYFDKVCNQYDRYISRNINYSRDGSNFNRRFNSNKSLNFYQNDNNRIENIDMYESETNTREQIPFKELTNFLDDQTPIPKIAETARLSVLNDVTEHQISSTPLNNSNVFFIDNLSKNNESNEERVIFDNICALKSPLSRTAANIAIFSLMCDPQTFLITNAALERI